MEQAAANPEQAGPQGPSNHVDLLSQMQHELNRMSELALSTIGELQRDAGPMSVNSEEIMAPTTSYNAEERAKGFAGELMQAYKNMQLLISKLPAVPGTEQEQLDRIRQLQATNEQLRQELEAEQTVAEEKLTQVHALYALLAQHELASR